MWRNFALGVLAPLLLMAGCVVDAVGSGQTLSAFDRPMALVRIAPSGEFQRIPVWAGRPTAGSPVRDLGGQGVPFGYLSRLALPDGSVIECVGHFARFSCTDGWRLESAST